MPEKRDLDPRLEAWRQMLRDHLAAHPEKTGRSLSIELGKDTSYIHQVLDNPPRRGLPDADDLRVAAKVLDIRLLTLIEACYGFSREELAADLGTLAARKSMGIENLPESDVREVENFIAWTKAKHQDERTRDGNGRGL